MANIFLSYSREDATKASRIARAFEGAGHSVWWDIQIGTGTRFSAEIEEALRKADLVVVLWSKASVKSVWVQDEAAAGRESGKLVPVLIEQVEPPLGFRQFQAFDLSGWKGRDKDPRTKELTDAVDAQLSGRAAQFGGTKHRFGWVPRPAVWAAAVALVLIISGIVALALLWNSRDLQRGTLSKPTIALLPLSTASPDPELRELASQTRDSIAHTFSQSGLPLRRMDSAPQNGRSAVDYLISGDLSRSGDKIVATVRLDEAAHRVTVFSHRFEAAGEDVRDLPERIGAQMAGNLTWSAPMMALDRRRPIDPVLLAEHMQGHDFTLGLDNLQAYQNAKRIAAKAPDWLSAQLDVAFGTAFVLYQLPRNERAQAVAEARRAAQRAMALGPDVGDIYATWCILRSETLMAECEDRLRAGRRIDPDAPFLNTFLSHLMRNVGRFDEAVDLARLAHTHDVYVPTKIAWMLKSLEYAGEGDASRELYQQGVRWWPEFKTMFFRNRLYGLLERGDFDAIRRLEKEVGSEGLPADYRDSGGLAAAVKSKSAPGVSRICVNADDYLLRVRCIIALATVGDRDGAYALAEKLYPRRVGRTAAETERIWLEEPEAAALEFITSPAAAPLRRDLRYLPLAQRVGLLDYWRTGRRPDFCRKEPEPICAQLLKRS